MPQDPAKDIQAGDSIRRISSMTAYTVTENDGKTITATHTVKIPVSALSEWRHQPKPPESRAS